MGFDIEEVFKVDDYMHFYAQVLTEERTQREVDALIAMLELKGSEKILDLACGFGRHSVELAKRGFDVVGVDLIDGFLDLARKRAEEAGVEIEFVKMDMRELDFDEEFDVVLSIFTSFGYFSDEENLRVLENVYRALKPGGKFLIDVLNRDFRATRFNVGVTEVGNDLMVDFPKFDPLTGRVNVRRLIVRSGERREVTYDIRIYNLTELNALLRSVGLNLEKVYGGWNMKAFKPNSRRIIAVSEKRENFQ